MIAEGFRQSASLMSRSLFSQGHCIGDNIPTCRESLMQIAVIHQIIAQDVLRQKGDRDAA